MANDSLIMQGMKRVLFVLLLSLSACATHPPAQEMSDARSAIKTAQELPGHEVRADKYLQSAEKALEDAAAAIRLEQYDRARNKALEAKRNAQQAAKFKQFQHN